MKNFFRRVWNFLNKPVLLTKQTRKDLVEDSQKYQNLRVAYDNLADENTRIRQDQQRLLVENSRLQNDLKDANQGIIGLEKKIIDLEDALEEKENNPFLKFGRKIFTGSNRGVLRIDSENKIAEVNENMLRYLGVEEDEILGKRLDELQEVPGSFGVYAHIYTQVAQHTVRQGKDLEGNVIDVKGVVFDAQGFTLSNERGDYQGGFVLLTPFITKQQGFLRKVFPDKEKLTITLESPVTMENLPDVYLGLLGLKEDRIRYLDFNGMPVKYKILDSFAKFYQCLRNDGKRLIFKNIPEDEKDYLLKRGIKSRDIQEVSKERGKRAYPLAQES